VDVDLTQIQVKKAGVLVDSRVRRLGLGKYEIELKKKLTDFSQIKFIVQNKNIKHQIVYLKNRGVYEDDNINWCVYSVMEHNIPPDIQKSDKTNIGLFHGPIQGLYTDIGYKFEDGFDVDKFNGCDLVLCGDIHKRQVFDIPGKKKAYMIGSTIQQNFGEKVRSHGYGVYDVEKDEYDFVDLPNPKPFLAFRINSIDDLVDGTEKLMNY
jgi:DNA repair exonuclease SbcCD nuclease subunit